MSSNKQLPSVEYLRQVLDYDPETGIFTWKIRKNLNKNWNKKYANKQAGAVHSGGWIQIQIDGVIYKAHRLAFMHYHGFVPDIIDHKNCNPSDNRIENLRPATKSQNQSNAGLRKDNKSGAKGVSWNKNKSKWHVRINLNNRTIYIGLYDNIDDAKEAYKNASKKYHKDFARSE